MPYDLQNQAFHLILHPDRATWDVHTQNGPGVHLLNARMSLHYRTGLEHVWGLERWAIAQIAEPQAITGPLGPARQLTVHFAPDHRQLEYRLFFMLPEQEPFFLWKVQLQNHSARPVHLEQLELLNLGFINISHGPQGFSHQRSITQADKSLRASIELSAHRAVKTTHTLKDLAFYSNGWQSWSYTGVYQPKDRYRPTRLGLFRQAMIENVSTARPKHTRLFRSDMFGVLGDRSSRSALLAGFLSQKNHFGSLEAYLDPLNPALRLWASGDGARLDPGEEVETDWACLFPFQLDTPDPLGPYLQAVARQHGLDPSKQAASPAGWCSWYYFSARDYTGTVTPQAIRQNALAAASLKPELPLEVLQIDDGFEQNVGDWFDFKPDFPQGLAPLAAEIRQAGLVPGLWLAPFIVHPKSNLYRQHPDWLLRDRLHRPVNAGFCWNAFTTALDLTHPAALDYCRQVVQRAVHEWGYDYLKLDFLYAAALPGKFHDPRQTRAQVLRSGLEAIRTAAGTHASLLGCGCPLGPAIGLVDSMRIGTDTTRSWYPSFQGIQAYFKRDTSLPSARYSLHNALTRSPLHQRWWTNDPDCLLVRADSNLTLTEIQSAASVIALIGGSLFLSDDLPQLPAERLRIAQGLLPLIDKRPYLLDWFDQPTPSLLQVDLAGATGQWSLLALFNWQDKPASKVLRLNQTYLDPLKPYLAREFWTGRIYQIHDGQLTIDEIPAHGVCLLAVRRLHPHRPIYLGSDLHISQGLEVGEWHAGRSELSFRLDRPGQVQGILDLYLPRPPQRVTCGDQDWPFQSLARNFYRLEANTNQSNFYTLQWMPNELT